MPPDDFDTLMRIPQWRVTIDFRAGREMLCSFMKLPLLAEGNFIGNVPDHAPNRLSWAFDSCHFTDHNQKSLRFAEPSNARINRAQRTVIIRQVSRMKVVLFA